MPLILTVLFEEVFMTFFLKVVVRLKGDRPCAGEKSYEVPARTIPLSL
jgi:hypothetical protein